MPLELSRSHLQDIYNSVISAYPKEGCGLLLGKFYRDDTPLHKITLEVWSAENTWSQDLAELTDAFTSPDGVSHSVQDRYWIDPTFLLQAQRYCSDRGLSIIGIYHSHPDHPATPSECDRVLAWPEYSYLIISVVQGVVHESRSWCLDAHRQFEHEALQLCEDL